MIAICFPFFQKKSKKKTSVFRVFLFYSSTDLAESGLPPNSFFEDEEAAASFALAAASAEISGPRLVAGSVPGPARSLEARCETAATKRS